MNDIEAVKPLIHDIRHNLGKLIKTEGENIYLIRGNTELAIESVFHNFLNNTAKVLLIGSKESIEYIEYICGICNLKYDSIYMKDDVFPLEKINEALNNHYDAVYIPYAEMNSGVVYNIDILKKNINLEHVLMIVNIEDSILMNPIQLDDGLIDIVIGNTAVFESIYAFVGISNKARKHLISTIDYFINYAKYDNYLSITAKWLDEYQVLYDTLLNINQLDMMEWYSYFSYLVAFIRTKIRTLGYHVVPYNNCSNAFIVIEVSNAEKVCEELFNKYQIIVYTAYKDMHNNRIIINMRDFQSLLFCLKLLRALRELDLK